MTFNFAPNQLKISIGFEFHPAAHVSGQAVENKEAQEALPKRPLAAGSKENNILGGNFESAFGKWK